MKSRERSFGSSFFCLREIYNEYYEEKESLGIELDPN